MSALRRSNIKRHLQQFEFDVLVIGGGITGAGIALDATTRGLKVALVEKQDYAEGTSSRSTKLIHGGLRYLKQGEIGLVREVGRERAILHHNAPHIVHAEKMLLPIIQNGTYGRLATSVGLWMYDRLAGVKRSERRVMLSKKETLATEPLLKSTGLQGGGLYYEYRTDDARLTIEVIKTAVAKGATCLNYTEVVDFTYNNGKVVGVQVRDCISSEAYLLRANKVINATGPWVDLLRERNLSLQGKTLHLTKGVHLVIPRRKLSLQQSVYFDTQDGRMIFAIPRGQSTYIGTTDTNYQGPLEQPDVTQEDIEYLLQAVNEMFPRANIHTSDITSSWAGLRPLIHEEGKSPSELSRKDEVFVSASGLISIAGGKLTGYRKMAERVVELVMKQLAAERNLHYLPCQTADLILSGGETIDRFELDSWVNQLVLQGCAGTDLPRKVIDLQGKYGSHTADILRRAVDLLRGGMDTENCILLAELQYGVEEEMVTNLADFLVRRTGRLYFESERMEDIQQPLERHLTRLFGWDEKNRTRENDNERDKENHDSRSPGLECRIPGEHLPGV
jgi:glycerol-3-phosphate dehydrogenase